jgi:hypothetical protein
MTAATPDITTDTPARHRELVESASRLRRRSSRPTAELMLVGGAVLVSLGVVLILLGWWGASRTPYLFEQIPYVISGAALGLGLIIAGGFCYFGYWLTQLVLAVRADTAETRAGFERLEAALRADDPTG